MEQLTSERNYLVYRIHDCTFCTDRAAHYVIRVRHVDDHDLFLTSRLQDSVVSCVRGLDEIAQTSSRTQMKRSDSMVRLLNEMLPGCTPRAVS